MHVNTRVAQDPAHCCIWQLTEKSFGNKSLILVLISQFCVSTWWSHPADLVYLPYHQTHPKRKIGFKIPFTWNDCFSVLPSGFTSRCTKLPPHDIYVDEQLLDTKILTIQIMLIIRLHSNYLDIDILEIIETAFWSLQLWANN